MMVLALLAIIVVGPEDLPKVMRSVGRFMAKIRSLGQEFKSAFDEMGRETEMAELRKEIEDLKQMGKLSDLTDNTLKDEMREIDNDLREGLSLDNPKSSPKESKSGDGE